MYYRNRRRTRYKLSGVIRGERRDIDVLTYSLDQAIALASSRGYSDLRRRTDSTTSRAQAQAEGRARPEFRPDPGAIREACKLLGITLPVTVQLVGNCKTRLGAHRFDGFRHKITLDKWQPADRANRTLWHELTHAMQAEKAGVAAWNAKRVPKAGRSQASYTRYKSHPIEAEADAVADQYAPYTRLVR